MLEKWMALELIIKKYQWLFIGIRYTFKQVLQHLQFTWSIRKFFFYLLSHLARMTIKRFQLYNLFFLFYDAVIVLSKFSSLTLLSDSSSQTGVSRSDLQDHAISMSLCMFGIILERFLTLTYESIAEQKSNENLNTINMLPEDAKVILPSLKVQIIHAHTISIIK